MPLLPPAPRPPPPRPHRTRAQWWGLGLVVGLAACATSLEKSGGGADPAASSDGEAVPPVDSDGDGVPAAEDCDDADPQVGATAPERCNGWDDDCNGLVDAADPGLTDGVLRHPDEDGDRWGTDEAVLVCPGDPGTSPRAGDCDDEDEDVHPDADEICGNGRDDDCDGRPHPCLPIGTDDPSALPTWGPSDTLRMAAGDPDQDGQQGTLFRTGDGSIFHHDGTSLQDWSPAEPAEQEALLLHGPEGDLTVSPEGALMVGGADEQTVLRWLGPVTAGLRLDEAETLEGTRGMRMLTMDSTGDGSATLVAGDPLAGTVDGLWGPGAVHLCGTDPAHVDDCGVALWGEAPTDSLGGALGSGDLNGDGYDDLVLGAPRAADTAGRAWVLAGPIGTDAALGTAHATFTGDHALQQLGFSVALVALDGEGLPPTLAIGVPGATDGGQDSGGVRLFQDPAGGLLAAAAPRSLLGFAPELRAGTALATVPDMSGDAHDELLVSGGDAVMLVTGPTSGALRLDLAGPRWGGVDGAAVLGGRLDTDAFGDAVLRSASGLPLIVSGAANW